MPSVKSQLKNWRGTTLGEYLDFYNGKSIKPATRGRYPVYGSNGKIGGSDKSLYEHAVIIGRVGAYCGSVQYEEGKFWASDNTIVAKTKDEGNENFAYYLLGNLNLNNYAGGAAQPLVTQTLLKQISVFIPAQETQRQIANILSTYDDLIENNTKRIKILEEIAQAIYREWFEKNAKLKNQNVKLSEIVKPQYGYTESASDEQIGPKYLRGTDINKNSYIDWSTVPYCKISDEDKKKYKLQKNDIVIIRMADPGKIGVVEQDVDAVFASYLIRLKIVDERVSPYYLFYFLNSDQYQNYIQGASGGTTRKSASAGVVTGTDIAIPPKDLVDKFEAKISLLRSELNNLLIQNANLRQARDLLLPKLVGGEIEVKK